MSISQAVPSLDVDRDHHRPTRWARHPMPDPAPFSPTCGPQQLQVPGPCWGSNDETGRWQHVTTNGSVKGIASLGGTYRAQVAGRVASRSTKPKAAGGFRTNAVVVVVVRLIAASGGCDAASGPRPGSCGTHVDEHFSKGANWSFRRGALRGLFRNLVLHFSSRGCRRSSWGFSFFIWVFAGWNTRFTLDADWTRKTPWPVVDRERRYHVTRRPRDRRWFRRDVVWLKFWWSKK